MTNDVIGLLRRHGLLVAFALFLAGVAITADGFLTPGNILDVLRQVSITGMIALGVTFVVVAGRLDLSVGSMLTLLTVIVVDQHNVVGPAAAIAITLAAGLAIGAWNGLLVGYLRLNALIVTLAMLSLLQGVTLYYSGGSNVNVVGAQTTWFALFGRGSVAGIPVPVILFLGGAAVAGFVLRRTTFGRTGLRRRRQRDGEQVLRHRRAPDRVPDLRAVGTRHRLCGDHHGQPGDGRAEHHRAGLRADGARRDHPRRHLAHGRARAASGARSSGSRCWASSRTDCCCSAFPTTSSGSSPGPSSSSRSGSTSRRSAGGLIA